MDAIPNVDEQLVANTHADDADSDAANTPTADDGAARVDPTSAVAPQKCARSHLAQYFRDWKAAKAAGLPPPPRPQPTGGQAAYMRRYRARKRA